MTPIEMIAAERERQIEKEGWTFEHDDQHTDESLAMAAALYAPPRDDLEVVERCKDCLTIKRTFNPWPWWYTASEGAWDKRRKHDKMRRLQIAGALIVAEMERLERAEEKAKEV
jgi:hypothetical protein